MIVPVPDQCFLSSLAFFLAFNEGEITLQNVIAFVVNVL